MLKLLGSLLILSGGGLMRYLQWKEERRRQSTLRELVDGLRRMSEEIRQTRRSLPQLLQTLAGECESEAATFFHAVAWSTQQGISLDAAWKSAAETLLAAPPVKSRIKQLGIQFRGDQIAVCKALDLATIELGKWAEEREREQPERERKASALCLCTAALIVIVLI